MKERMVRYNFLVEKLPDMVDISGRKYEIRSDFRVGFKLEEIMRNPNLTDEMKILDMLNEYYPVIPMDLKGAIEKALWFYRCGNEKSEQKERKGRYRNRNRKQEIAYSFCQDAPYLYAAFLEQYGIDLCEVKYMHWWKFCSMFESLNEETQMSKIMYYRQVSTIGMPKEKRMYITEMKNKYRLNDLTSTENKVSLAQRNADWREYIKNRYRGLSEVK